MSDAATQTLPLDGIRVVEFCQTIMGPSAGLILADLGADVIKVEPAPEEAKGPNVNEFNFAGITVNMVWKQVKEMIAKNSSPL